MRERARPSNNPQLPVRGNRPERDSASRDEAIKRSRRMEARHQGLETNEKANSRAKIKGLSVNAGG